MELARQGLSEFRGSNTAHVVPTMMPTGGTGLPGQHETVSRLQSARLFTTMLVVWLGTKDRAKKHTRHDYGRVLQPLNARTFCTDPETPGRQQEASTPSLWQGSMVSHQPHTSSQPPQPRVGRAGQAPLLSSPRSRVSPYPSFPRQLYPQHLTVASSCDGLHVMLLHRSSFPARTLPLPTASLSTPLLPTVSAEGLSHILISSSQISTSRTSPTLTLQPY